MVWLGSKFLPLLLLVTLVVACQGSAELKMVTPLEAYGMVRNDFGVLVDLREEATSWAQGASKMPRSKIISADPSVIQPLNKISKQKLLLLYGKKVANDSPVVAALQKHGFSVAYLGTFLQWQEAKLPITSSK